MAITGCYSAPLFNTLIALGITSIREILYVTEGPIMLPLSDLNVKIPFIMCGFILGQMIWSFIRTKNDGYYATLG